MKRRGKIILSITLFVVFLLLFGPAYYLLDFSLHHRYDWQEQQTEDLKEVYEDYPWITDWLDSLRTTKSLKDTFIIRSDGAKLHAKYALSPIKSNKTAMIIHGYHGSSTYMLMIGYMYNKIFKYNIFLPDLYAHGQSDGHWIGMGLKDYPDVLTWAKIANERFGTKTRMVVHGISMGAATTMMVSGHDSTHYIKCYVEDCGYTDAEEEFKYKLKEMYGLPPFPYIYIASFMNKIVNGWFFKEASPLEAVRNCSKPMFFIHGGDDHYVPTNMVFPLYEAKSAPKQLWIEPGVAHAEMYKDYHSLYTEKVGNFIDKYNR